VSREAYVTLGLEGFEELARALEALPRRVGRAAMLRALRAGARPVVRAARTRVPVKTGALKKGIIVRAVRAERGSAEAAVKVGPARHLFYGHIVEFGSGPHKIAAKRARTLAIGPVVIGRVVQHPGAAARPFLRPAFEETKAEAARIAGERLGLEIEKAAAKLARGR